MFYEPKTHENEILRYIIPMRINWRIIMIQFFVLYINNILYVVYI